jgi:hypothetical protein
MSKFSLKINKASYSNRFVKHHNYKNTDNIDPHSKCLYLAEVGYCVNISEKCVACIFKAPEQTRYKNNI